MRAHDAIGRSRLAGLLLIGMILAGCGGKEPPADFVWLLGSEPETIDPGLASDQTAGRVALNLFEGLTLHDADLRIVPGIARAWEVSDDGLTYTFHLRPADWSDGRPVTARDFAYAWERVLAPSTAARYASLLYPVAGAREYNRGELTDPALLGFRADDDSTFVVTLHSPCAYFLDLCSYYTLLPVPAWTIEAHRDLWTRAENLVTNGPFTLERWSLNRSLRFRRNPSYWNAGAIALETTDALVGDNINANFNLYMSGVLDWTDSGAIPLFIVPELIRRADFHQAPYFSTYFYRFNVTRAPFDDARVRRAFSLAVNREDITQYVLRAGQEPAYSLVPPGVPGYGEARLAGRDVAQARWLLAEAGYPGGEGFPHVELLFNTSEAHKQIAEVLQQEWKEALGVHVDLVNQEWKVFLATTQGLDYWISRGSWIGDYVDPNTFLDVWTSTNGNNRTGYRDPGYDALIARAALTLDPVERMRLLHEAEEKVVVEDAVILPLYFYVVQNLYDERDFSGLKPNLLNMIDLRAVRPLRGHRGHPRDLEMPRAAAVNAVPGPGHASTRGAD